jgi:hypothetical protein
MSIELRVEPYCQDCPEFEAKPVKLTFTNGSSRTNIFCVHEWRCKAILRYLKQKESGIDESAN